MSEQPQNKSPSSVDALDDLFVLALENVYRVAESAFDTRWELFEHYHRERAIFLFGRDNAEQPHYKAVECPGQAECVRNQLAEQSQGVAVQAVVVSEMENTTTDQCVTAPVALLRRIYRLAHHSINNDDTAKLRALLGQREG